MLEDWLKERAIRRLLRKLGKQRIAAILAGNVWLVEKAPPDSETVREQLRTCHLRGWIEPIANAVPTGRIRGNEIPMPPFMDSVPIYKLTDSGWHVIQRTHFWVVASCLLAALAAIVGILQLLQLQP